MNTNPTANKHLSALLIIGVISLALTALVYLLAVFALTGGYSSPFRDLMSENALGEQVYTLQPLADNLFMLGVFFIGLHLTAAALTTRSAPLELEWVRPRAEG